MSDRSREALDGLATDRSPTRRACLGALALPLLAGCFGDADDDTAAGEPDDDPADEESAVDEAPANDTDDESDPDDVVHQPADDPDPPRELSPDGHDPWPMVGFSSHSDGFNPGATLPRGDEIDEYYRASYGGIYFPMPPAIGGDQIISIGDDHMYAFSLADGEQRWDVDLGYDAASRGPAVDGDHVYISSNRTSADILQAYDVETGSLAWEAAVESPLSSPKLIDELVYVTGRGDDGVTVSAFDRTDGDERWRHVDEEGVFRQVGRSFASGAAGETIYSGLNGMQSIIAIDVADGAERWRYPIDTRLFSSTTIHDGEVYAVDHDNRFHAVDADSGEELWTVAIGEEYRSIRPPPAAKGDTIVVASADGVWGIDWVDQAVRWFTDTRHSNDTPIAIVEDVAIVGGLDVDVLSLEDGEHEWRFNVPSHQSLFSGVAVGNEVVFTNSCIKEDAQSLYDHYLHALGGF